jgi:hypothetical protein
MIKVQDIKAAPKKGRPRIAGASGVVDADVVPSSAVTRLSARPEGSLLRVRKGRPRIEDKGKSFEATKPWEALGMSRRTWYKRRKEKADETR